MSLFIRKPLTQLLKEAGETGENALEKRWVRLDW